MPNTECQETRRAELFVRSDLPAPSQKRRAAVERRLDELQCSGVIDEHGTVFWEKRVPVEGSTGRRERTLYDEFVRWADDHDACLAPFFDTRSCYSTETGERRTELVLPALCLALYDGEELTQVAPFACGGSPRSVEDCLDDLATGRNPLPAGAVTASTAD